MAEIPQFSPGDVVVHATRPEWGSGVVDEAVKIVHEGKAAQRLIVKFIHHGRVTLNTAVAPLLSKDAAQPMSNMSNKSNMSNTSNRRDPFSSRSAAASSAASQGERDKDWLDRFEKKESELHKLPDALNDPFTSLSARLEAALDTFRFSTEARSLIEWAVAQTGLGDPMTKYTRHELEVGFERYARDRDVALKELVRQFKHDGRLADLEQLRRKLRLPAAVSALDRARNSI
ncbi:MAG: DUF3553 domain-containing protein [Phycisphaeraceae bacterium]